MSSLHVVTALVPPRRTTEEHQDKAPVCSCPSLTSLLHRLRSFSSNVPHFQTLSCGDCGDASRTLGGGHEPVLSLPLCGLRGPHWPKSFLTSILDLALVCNWLAAVWVEVVPDHLSTSPFITTSRAGPQSCSQKPSQCYHSIQSVEVCPPGKMLCFEPSL